MIELYNIATQTTQYTPTDEYVNPLAQTFLIDRGAYPEGLFLSAVDLFFATVPVQITPFTIEIRRVQDGAVTSTVVATTSKIGSTTTVDANNKKIFNTVPIVNDQYVTPDPTLDTHYTRFFFSEPVYLQPGFEYALVLKSNSRDFRVFIGELGKQVIGSSQVISQQPYAGTLFYSQNGSTWTASQNEDLMFVLHRAVFSTAQVIPVFNLAETINTSSTNLDVDNSGNFDFDVLRVSGEIGEFDATQPYSKFAIKVTDPTTNNLETYTVPLQEDLRLPKRARVRSSNATCVQFTPTVKTDSDAVTPVFATQSLRMTAIRHVIDNGELYANGFTITNPGSGFLSTGSGTFPLVFTSNTGSGAVATATVTAGKVTGITLTSQGSGYTETPTLTWSSTATTNAVIVYRGETSPSCQITGEQKTRYITRRVNLVDGFDAGDIKAYILANRPAGTNIDMYYKVLSSADKDLFETKNWTQMILRPEHENKYSSAYTQFAEYEYRTKANTASYTSGGVTYDRFNTFAIKLVLRTTDSTVIPRVDNLRVIALDA